MEVSKTLQENIRNVQNQLKLAIRNHQVILLKHQSNPLSGNVKVQLWEIQKHIISLGEAQKRLVQQLRKELEANSTNCTLSPATVHSPHGPSPSPYQEPPVSNHKQLTPDSMLVPSPHHCVESTREQKCLEQVDVSCPISKEPEVPERTTSPKYESHLVDTNIVTIKLDFMSSLGLVTQEVLADLRNRRVERKRRSTANHVQFVYGSTWDACKRKKGNYLLTSSGAKYPVKPPRGASPPEEKGSPSSTLRIAGLPDSLTIQRITSNEPLCVVCRKTDNVQVCTKCSNSYHISCISDGNCPRCYKAGSSPPNSTSSPTISDEAEAGAANEEQCTLCGEEYAGAAQGTARLCHSEAGCFSE